MLVRMGSWVGAWWRREAVRRWEVSGFMVAVVGPGRADPGEFDESTKVVMRAWQPSRESRRSSVRGTTEGEIR